MKTYKSFVPKIKLVTEKTDVYLPKVKISHSKEVYEYIKDLWPVDINYREAMAAVYLNRANNTVGFSILGIGGVSGVIADGKILFQEILSCNASACVVIHNHPSGNLVPSETDKRLTKKWQQFAKLIDIEILDHLIIAENGYVSMADEGLM